MEPPPVQAKAPLTKEGLLWKKARGRSSLGSVYRPWALRWCVYEDSRLQYFKQEGGLWGGGSKKPHQQQQQEQPAPDGDGTPHSLQQEQSFRSLKGTLLLHDAEVSSGEHDGKEFCIVLSNCHNTENSRVEVVFLAAPTAGDLGEWLFVLSKGVIVPSKAVIDRKRSAGVPVTNLQKAASRTTPRIKDLYDVQGQLGKGGFSVVKKGVCRETGEVWALKMIQNSVFTRHKQQTEEEVKVLASLSHPGIVGLHEVVHTSRYFVIVMELMQGGELFDRIVERRRYLEFDAKVLAAHILDAVRYLHENDIVHRDIKPENLLFDKPGDNALLKLTDFGFATMYDRHQKLTATCGTPEYVAPEILNEQEYGTAVDMWSCGVVIYIMLCGFPPFHGQTEQELFDRICQGKFKFVKPYWDAVSNDAKSLVKGLLEINPKKRLTAQQALNHKWFNEVVGNANAQAPPLPNSQSNVDLSRALQELKRYNAFRKLRKGVIAVIAARWLMVGVEMLKARVEQAGKEE